MLFAFRSHGSSRKLSQLLTSTTQRFSGLETVAGILTENLVAISVSRALKFGRALETRLRSLLCVNGSIIKNLQTLTSVVYVTPFATRYGSGILDMSACLFFLYAYAEVCSRSCSRTSNIHTLHSLVICVRRLSVFMRKFVAALVLERVISIHFIRLLFVFNSPLECLGVSLCLWAPSFRTRNHVVTHLFWLFFLSFTVLYVYAKVCSRSCFRTSNMHTLHSLVICVRRLSVLGFCYVCGRLFVERVIFTHLSACLFVFKLIISVHGCYTPATGRHEPSRIVAVRANLATRLGSSRSVNFLRGRCTLPLSLFAT